MKLLAYLAALPVFIVGLFLVVVNFSAVETKYECKGELAYRGTAAPKTIYIEIAEYRWWVGLWADSDGNVNLEIPNVYVDYFSNVTETGTQLQISDYSNDPQGNFSTVSKTLAIKTPYGFFDGKCSKL